jgi:dTDP-4-dehydrorhamnose 3,5-epimerase-like enzyme
MIKRNSWNEVKEPLEVHEDDRGVIADLFYKDKIDHVAIIKSVKGAWRGSHYHKQSTQTILVTKGRLEYWYTDARDDNDSIKCEIMEVGDLITSTPYEIHALNMLEDNEFVVFSKGPRGGSDYESDTFRITPHLIEQGQSQ